MKSSSCKLKTVTLQCLSAKWNNAGNLTALSGLGYFWNFEDQRGCSIMFVKAITKIGKLTKT